MADHEPGGSVRDAQSLSRVRGRPPPERAAPAGRRRLPDPSDYPFVRAVGRLPAKVHTKLLIAFVGTAVLVVAVGLLGLRVLGQSNDRAGGSASCKNVRSPTASSRATRGTSACSSTRIRAGLLRGQSGDRPGRSRHERRRDRSGRLERALVRLRRDPRGRLGFVPPAEDRLVLREIRAKSERLSTVIGRVVEASIGGASDEEQRPLRNKAHRLASDLYQTAADLASATTVADRGGDRAERELVREPAQPFVGVAAAAMVLALLLGLRPLLVGDRADPADRLPAGRDRLGRLLRPRRRRATATSSAHSPPTSTA